MPIEQQGNIAELYQQALIEEDRRLCDAFAAEAESRGFVFYPDTGLYADEDGHAVNDRGERV